MKKITLSLLTVTSLLALAACGSANNASTSKTSTSSTKTSVSSSSSSSKSSSSSQKKTTSSSQETVSGASSAVASSSSVTQPASDSAPATDATSNTGSSSSSSTAKQEKTPAQAATKDVSNIASFVGTWANDRGESVTINADGSVITTASDGRTYNMGLSFTQELNGVGFYGVYVPDALVGGAGLLYIPAGVTNPHIGTTDAQDTLVIGQDVSADEHPYYRQ